MLRVGIAAPVLGIPSEIWIERQLSGFTQIHPTLLTWNVTGSFDSLYAGREVIQMQGPLFPRRTLPRRILSRFGASRAILPRARVLEEIMTAAETAKLDAVLCHFMWTAIPVAQALSGRVPVVVQVHGRDVSSRLRDRAYRSAVARTIPRLAHVIAVGSHQLSLLAEIREPARSSVIPCGAPLETFYCAPKQRSADDPVRFIAVGRLSAEKGVLQTISAFDLVRRKVPEATLTIIGGGPLSDEVSARVGRSPARNSIRLLGMRPPADVAAELCRAHVFVQHSMPVNGWCEGFGVTLTEAAAAGLPLVVSDLGGIPDQVTHGVNGLMFRPGDVAEQARLMATLARNEGLRRELATAARVRAGEFDAGRLSARVEDVLIEAAGG